MFNVAIIGASQIEDYKSFKEKCIFFLRNKAKEGITIYATEEADVVTRFATEFRINIQYFYCDWRAYGKNAIKERNKQLLATCNGVICFEDGLKNTEMFVKMAKSIGTPVKNAFKKH